MIYFSYIPLNSAFAIDNNMLKSAEGQSRILFNYYNLQKDIATFICLQRIKHSTIGMLIFSKWQD